MAHLNSFNVEVERKEFIHEQRLWTAVLRQAIEDAIGFSSVFITDDERKDLKEWFSIKNKCFNQVCEYAGFEPSYILRLFNRLKTCMLYKKGVLWNVNQRTKEHLSQMVAALGESKVNSIRFNA